MDDKYRHILSLPHHRSSTRPPMSQWDRAAQFAPFSALSGHREGVAEVARVTQPRMELTEDAIAQLDGQIRQLADRTEDSPPLWVTYFVPDGEKEGGDYVTVVGRLKKIDRHRQRIVLVGGMEIPIWEIVAMEG